MALVLVPVGRSDLCREQVALAKALRQEVRRGGAAVRRCDRECVHTVRVYTLDNGQYAARIAALRRCDKPTVYGLVSPWPVTRRDCVPRWSVRPDGSRALVLYDLWLQRLELLVTVMLARGRQPPMGCAGVLHAEFMAEVIALPSGLLAMVCEAIVKLAVRNASLYCRTSRTSSLP